MPRRLQGVVTAAAIVAGGALHLQGQFDDEAKSRTTLTRPHNATPCKCLHGERLWFIHVPRTGGGTIEHSICPLGDRYPGAACFTARGWNRVNRFGTHSTPADLVRCGTADARVFDDAFVLATVRDPFARFVSAANHIALRRRGFINSLAGFRRRCETSDLDRRADWGVHAFCRPQTDFVGREGECADRVVETQDLDACAAPLLERLGYTLAARVHVSAVEPAPFQPADLDYTTRQWILRRYATDFALLRRLRHNTEHQKNVAACLNETAESGERAEDHDQLLESAIVDVSSTMYKKAAAMSEPGAQEPKAEPFQSKPAADEPVERKSKSAAQASHEWMD